MHHCIFMKQIKMKHIAKYISNMLMEDHKIAEMVTRSQSLSRNQLKDNFKTLLYCAYTIANHVLSLRNMYFNWWLPRPLRLIFANLCARVDIRDTLRLIPYTKVLLFKNSSIHLNKMWFFFFKLQMLARST